MKKSFVLLIALCIICIFTSLGMAASLLIKGSSRLAPPGSLSEPQRQCFRTFCRAHITPENQQTVNSGYGYDSISLESKESTYDSSGHLIDYATFEYNSSGLMTKFSLYGATGTLMAYTSFEYNSSGLESKESTFDSSGHLSHYATSEYNPSGLMTKPS